MCSWNGAGSGRATGARIQRVGRLVSFPAQWGALVTSVACQVLPGSSFSPAVSQQAHQGTTDSSRWPVAPECLERPQVSLTASGWLKGRVLRSGKQFFFVCFFPRWSLRDGESPNQHQPVFRFDNLNLIAKKRKSLFIFVLFFYEAGFEPACGNVHLSFFLSLRSRHGSNATSKLKSPPWTFLAYVHT